MRGAHTCARRVLGGGKCFLGGLLLPWAAELRRDDAITSPPLPFVEIGDVVENHW